jgi:large subunit ribosomal protein L23
MSKTKATAEKKLLPEHYQAILSPVITEKATNNSAFGQVTFRVLKDATKPLIKTAVEKLFNVKVKSVNTQIRKGKTKRFRGREGQRSDVKIAIVTLEEGNTIDITTGL